MVKLSGISPRARLQNVQSRYGVVFIAYGRCALVPFFVFCSPIVGRAAGKIWRRVELVDTFARKGMGGVRDSHDADSCRHGLA